MHLKASDLGASEGQYESLTRKRRQKPHREELLGKFPIGFLVHVLGGINIVLDHLVRS